MHNETKQTYDRFAPRYAARAFGPNAPALRRELDAFAARLQPGARVLDLGCGPGNYSLPLAARELHVIGLDLSPGMLREAAARGIAPLVQADMLRLPFCTAGLDGVWACASLLHLPKSRLPAALREIRRVVRPGGVFHCSLKQGDDAAWVETLTGDGARFFAYYQADELDALLRGAGFKIDMAYVNPSFSGRSHDWLVRYCRMGKEDSNRE